MLLDALHVLGAVSHKLADGAGDDRALQTIAVHVAVTTGFHAAEKERDLPGVQVPVLGHDHVGHAVELFGGVFGYAFHVAVIFEVQVEQHAGRIHVVSPTDTGERRVFIGVCPIEDPIHVFGHLSDPGDPLGQRSGAKVLQQRLRVVPSLEH